MFLCRSLVLNVAPTWGEFWYSQLVPWVHYVPLKADGSDADDIVHFLDTNPEIAETIANNGREFVLQRLRPEDVQSYWDDLLSEYAKVQNYDPPIDKSLVVVADVGPPATTTATKEL
eukprot:SAG22_NODE_1426_length_4457_cov_8.244149_2_plen_117_part_00